MMKRCRCAPLNNYMLGSVIVAHHDGAGPLELLFTDASAQVTRRALILLDLNLPKIAGLKVLRRIRAYERTHFIPSPFFPFCTERRHPK